MLFEEPPEIGQVRAALSAAAPDVEVVAERPGLTSWAFGGPTLVLAYRPQVNGHVVVDVVDHPWPDGMGDPEAEAEGEGSEPALDPEAERTIFGAWTLGQFGPCTWPGGLERAGRQSWMWHDAAEHIARHRAFVRLRITYVLGADDRNAPVTPQDYSALDELEFLSALILPLLEIPGALAYFNPGGEVVRNRILVDHSLDAAESHGLPPLDLWANIRVYEVNPDWMIMDTVGMSQLELPDLEACFPAGGRYEPSTVDALLRNITLHLLDNGKDVFNSGDSVEGPGQVRWQIMKSDNSLCTPPRATFRWFPTDGSIIPRELIPETELETGASKA